MKRTYVHVFSDGSKCIVDIEQGKDDLQSKVVGRWEGTPDWHVIYDEFQEVHIMMSASFQEDFDSEYGV